MTTETADEILASLDGYERACLAGWLLCGVTPVFKRLHDLGLVTRTRDCDAWRFHFTDLGQSVRDILLRR